MTTPPSEQPPAVDPTDIAPGGIDPGDVDPGGVDPTLRMDRALEGCLERFLPHAPVGTAERLRDFLPDGDRGLWLFLLAELIKADMAAVAERGETPRLERYCDALPELMPLTRAPLDVVIEEYQLRREAGAEPRMAEYAERFPHLADVLVRFSCDAETVAAAVRPVPDELADGDTIDDFVIVRQLGRGAFARVYLARQVSMQRLVALKVSAGRGDEPQALAQFDHPNIVRVFDQRSLHGGRTHLLYMQYLPGGTLSDVVQRVRWCGASARSGRLLLDAVDDNLLAASQSAPDGSATRAWLAKATWPVAVAWLGGQLASALDDSHRRERFHRDVKPANVLLTSEGVPKLADFNVSMAGAAGRAGAAATLGGSIGYMAPEHLAAIGGLAGLGPDHVREPADIYSLAVLLWEVWQGRRPFPAGGEVDSWTEALADQIVSRDLPLIEPERRPGDSAERVLEAALREALRGIPQDRPASAAEFAGRLRLALHPEAAEAFDLPATSWRGWAGAAPTVPVIAAAVLLPNIAAGFFNYFYNRREVILPHADPLSSAYIPEIKSFFMWVSVIVNVTFFPLGFALAYRYGAPIARSIDRAKAGEALSPREIDEVFTLRHRGALLSGALWGLAGIVFPVALLVRFADFPVRDGLHFFFSQVLCGGVAAIYPYFLLTALVASVYYPILVRPTMSDPAYDRRGERLRMHTEWYLYAAAGIPLAAVLALVAPLSRPGSAMARDMVVVGVLATVGGLAAAFTGYRQALRNWARIKPVLGAEGEGRAPSAWDSTG